MRPKFEVGEVVLLVSVTLPERNGEYAVIDVFPMGHCEVDGKPYNMTQIGYRLDGADETNDSLFHQGPTIFSESALRKKHTPGELSFTDLMASLSSPKLITHQT
jgi:hypothetical protein